MTMIMQGTDIPFVLKNLPEGTIIKRLDFAQHGEIKVTKTGEDFTIDGTTAYSSLTQEDTLKFDNKFVIEVQLSVTTNGVAKRTVIKTVSPGKILYEGVI